MKNSRQCCYQSLSAGFSHGKSILYKNAVLLSVPASVFCFCLKENSNFTESSCKACGSTEEANNCVEVIVTNESTSCTCPSSGTLLGSPKIKKGMFSCSIISIFYFYKAFAIYGVNSEPVFNKESLPQAGGWNQVIFKDPSNPNHFGLL